MSLFQAKQAFAGKLFSTKSSPKKRTARGDKLSSKSNYGEKVMEIIKRLLRGLMDRFAITNEDHAWDQYQKARHTIQSRRFEKSMSSTAASAQIQHGSLYSG